MIGTVALLIIDVQNDFCPGGALPVPGGDRVIGPLNRIAARFAASGLPVLASRDWHPATSSHFQEHGGPWPIHCVQGTRGAGFHPELCLPEGVIVLSKGTDPEQDGYSAFEGVTWTGQPLAELLEGYGIDQLYTGGLATDYCVRATVLDALGRGFAVTLLTDAVAGVDLQAGDSRRALEEMTRAGARLTAVDDVELSGPGRSRPAPGPKAACA